MFKKTFQRSIQIAKKYHKDCHFPKVFNRSMQEKGAKLIRKSQQYFQTNKNGKLFKWISSDKTLLK